MRTSNVVTTADSGLRLSEAVGAALARRRDTIVRVEIPVEPMCALTWLWAQPWPDRVFWSGRDDGRTMAGAGIAEVIEASSVDALEAKLQPRLAGAGGALRYFGSMRFQPEAIPAEEWKAFPPIRFVLPRVELQVTDGATTLAVNISPGESTDEVATEIEQIEWEPPMITDGLPEAVDRVDCPTELAWRRSIEDVLATMQTTDLKKVVLARRSSFTFDSPLDPFVLMNRMRSATHSCFHALIGVGQGTAERTAFLTATPERLFRMEGGGVVSEAVAGTRVRSPDPGLDQLLRDELLHSEKDHREQAYVLEAVRSALEPLTDSLMADPRPTSFNLASGRHLRSIVNGSLTDRATAFDLLRSLHPTPAVGGSPRESALAAIARHEPFDRGLYAGPIGWIGRDAAEFAVGIRSGLVKGDRLHLYSGAGIVEGSDPAVEWHEIEHKLDDFSFVLGLLA